MEEKSVCEKEVFRIVFRDYFEQVKNYIYYHCGDHQVSEDIVQESLIKLWENCVKVSFKDARSFIYKVAKNKMLNHFKHNKVVVNFKTNNQSEYINKESPEYLIEEKEFKQRLMRCIQNLPEKQRVCYLLSRMEKKSYREISEIEDITVKAVEKRMQQALIYLKDRLGKLTNV